MSLDPDLIERIKANFARKSSAQLQVIVNDKSSERWSPEAVVAAGELLRARQAGRAKEPLVAEAEPEPPTVHYDPDELALGVLSGLLTGIVHIPYTEFGPVENPDLPLPFGKGMAWLAVESTATRAVAGAVGLKGARAATWEEGVKAAHQASVFVTPPLGDWTLVASTGLFPTGRIDAFVKPLLEKLSKRFGDAQYFCTQETVKLSAWARARKGALVRGFGWLGQTGTTLWTEGALTKEERRIGLLFSNSPVPTTGAADPEKVDTPDEDCVMGLAANWSIDPSALDALDKEPAPGLLGTVAWTPVEKPVESGPG
jgi:hypothetical protein